MTEAGTTAPALSPPALRLTVVLPPVPESVTVQRVDPPGVRTRSSQERAAIEFAAAAVTETFAVFTLPFSMAMRIAVSSRLVVPAVTVNVAVTLPAPTVTDAGTGSAARLLDSVTDAPPVLDTVTVQVELAPAARLDGLHEMPVSVARAPNEMVAIWLLPFNNAVMVAV